MNKKATAISIMIILALSVAALLVQNQINQLQNQIDEIKAKNNELQSQINASKTKITQFLANQSYGGGFMNCDFDIKIQNLGAADVNNVLLEVLALNTARAEVKRYNQYLGTLHSGEEREVIGHIYMYVFLIPQHFQLQAMLEWNGMVLDEQTLP